MRIIGIDPGYAIVGYGIVEKKGAVIKPIQYGAIKTSSTLPMADRLQQIFKAITDLIEEYKPHRLALEKLFFNRNVTTALQVSQARGVIMLAAAQGGLEIEEFTPLQVKIAVVGYGQAEKKQIQEMVKLLLSLKEPPKPDDVADALAIAIADAQSYTIKRAITAKS